MSDVWTTLRERTEPRASDEEAVRRIVGSTGFFTQAEIEIAAELVRERLRLGLASGYHFLFLDQADGPVGYTCYGEIPCTVGSFDLYWIAVDEVRRGQGLGARLLHRTEALVRALAGRRVYIETSGRELYAPTQGFYLRHGYRLEARLEDFYGPGDAKLMYVKALGD